VKELIIDISGRKIRNAKELKDLFRDLKDGKHLVTVKDFRKRSLNQNAYYWGVVVPMVKDGLYQAGFDEVTTNEDAHEMLKQIHLTKRMVSKLSGDVIDLAGSSAKLTIPEFNDYIERICKWAVEYLGVVIPSPEEQYAVFVEYNEQLQESIVDNDIE
jgi:hypothetical protein